MFTIIDNYKKLYLLTLRSEFEGDNGSKGRDNEPIKKLNNLNNLKEEVERNKPFIEAQNWYKEKGATVLQIANIQNKLFDEHLLSSEKRDGEFSIETFNALIAFQENYRLGKLDGIAGTETLRKLGLIKKNQTYRNFYIKGEDLIKPFRIETKNGLEEAKEYLNKIFTENTLIKTDGKYFLVFKDNKYLKDGDFKNLIITTRIKQINNIEDKTVFSLEQIIQNINKEFNLYLAFQKGISENEKLSYIMVISGIKDFEILDLDKDNSNKNKELKEEIMENKEKIDRKNIEKELANLKIPLYELIGKQVEKLDENNPEDNKIFNWLRGFDKDDLTNGIKLDDIKINMKNKSVSFSFDNSGFNITYNENLVIKNCIKEDGTLDMSVFKKGLKDVVKLVIERINERK